MDYKKIIEKWQKLIEQEGFVEEHFNEKYYKKALCKVGAKVNGNCTIVDVFDLKELQEYVFVLKDGRIHLRGRFLTFVPINEKSCPLTIKKFREFSRRVFEEKALEL